MEVPKIFTRDHWRERANGALMDWHNEEMRKAEEELSRLRNSHAQEKYRLERSLDKEQNAHVGDVQRLQERLRAAEENHVREMSRQQDDYTREINNQKITYSQRQQELTARYEDIIQRLRDDLEKLNEALVKRDDELYLGMVFTTPDLPHSPDEQIKLQFTELQQRVEDLSRLEWKPDRTIWPETTIQRLSHDLAPRLVKKAILQDAIWSVLFRAVFCSPFRMLGDEGLRLAQEWKRECDPESSSDGVHGWPMPSFKAERWRYMTMRECQEALQRPRPSQLDPRGRVIDGFKQSLRALISSLKDSLGELVNLDATHIEQIQRLSTHVSHIWFNFCMHRCRIRISLDGRETMTDAEKAAAAESDLLELTERPEVGRFGNVKGTELDSFTFISGCEGRAVAVVPVV